MNPFLFPVENNFVKGLAYAISKALHRFNMRPGLQYGIAGHFGDNRS
jgi:hypothetical protein